jgi:dihydrofolate reductase
MFENFWPVALKDPKTSPEDRVIAQLIQDAEKHVFSNTLDHVTWHNAELHKEIDPEFIKELKQKEGGDIVIWGSGTVCSELARLGLIDEYVFMINPVILGKGKSLFKDVIKYINLKRTDLRQFSSGNILVTYKPIE